MDAIPGDWDPALAQASIRGWTGLIFSLLAVAVFHWSRHKREFA
jgi:hypothetical protein